MLVQQRLAVLTLAVLTLGSCHKQQNWQSETSNKILELVPKFDIPSYAKEQLQATLQGAVDVKDTGNELPTADRNVHQEQSTIPGLKKQRKLEEKKEKHRLEKSQHSRSAEQTNKDYQQDISSSKDSTQPKANPNVYLKNVAALKHEKQKYLSAKAHGREISNVAPQILQEHRQKLKSDKLNRPKNEASGMVSDVKESFHRLIEPSGKTDESAKSAERKNMFNVKPASKKFTANDHQSTSGKRARTISDYVDVHHELDKDEKIIKMNTHGHDLTFKAERMPYIPIEMMGVDNEIEKRLQEELKNKTVWINKGNGAAFYESDESKELLQGRFRVGGDNYYMEKANRKGKHIVKRSMVAERKNKILDGAFKGVKTITKRKYKRSISGNFIEATIEVGILADFSVWEFHLKAGNKTRQGGLDHLNLYFIHMFNLMNMRYANIKNPQLKINISLAKIKVIMSEEEDRKFSASSRTGNGAIYGDKLLDSLSNKMIVDSGNSSAKLYDHLMAFTYLDLYDSEDSSAGLLGIAYSGGVCDHERGTAVSVVEASKYDLEKTVNVAAHELGHNLGADHDAGDATAECEPDAGWIMGAYIDHPTSKYFYFSCCSQRDFFSTLMDGRQCIHVDAHEQISSNSKLSRAGSRSDTNYLCNLATGRDACELSYYGDNDLDMCKGVYCKSQWSDSECTPAGFIPHSGSECGDNKQCLETRCVPTNQTDIDNGPGTCELMNGNCGYNQLECDSGTTWYSDATCYDKIWKCDNETDCKDGSDEWFCDCPDSSFTCGPEGFTNRCVNKTQRCDGIENCFNGADEEDCEHGSCPDDYSKCDSGAVRQSSSSDYVNCIPDSYLCDGHFDCDDLSDERDCDCPADTAYTCAANMQVDFTTCITDFEICDGHWDCKSGEDESNCICGEDLISCANGDQCIESSWVCDGESDCSDNSDEFNCTCSPGFTACEDGRGCIHNSWVCDGESDCEDHSDEADCPCSVYGQFDCQDHDSNHRECFDVTQTCDGIDDCASGFDESLCNDFCPADFDRCVHGGLYELTANFTTNPACFHESLKCNHDEDCVDGSDEEGCTCSSYGYIACNSTANLTNPCIPPSWVCDSEDDCGDMEDETDCPCPAKTMKCDSGNSSPSTCIPFKNICDGVDNCIDGSDERNCSVTCDEARCETGGVMWPPFGSCIPDSYVCDNYVDCYDLSDELSCTLEDSCDADAVLRCLLLPTQASSNFSGLPDVQVSFGCLTSESICDGKLDCLGGLDEIDCSCGQPDEFRCPGTPTCIIRGFVCDGWDDCGDGSDESNCPCKPNQYRCSDGGCIPLAWVCDTEHDCTGGDDEMICNVPCSSNEMRCHGGVDVFTHSPCISEGYECDGYADCHDYSDEKSLRCNDTCENGTLQCQLDKYDWTYDGYRSFVCLEESKICDGESDCVDGRDEIGCSCNHHHYRCLDGKCIPDNWQCDGIADCENSEDEFGCGGVVCGEGKKLCPNSTHCIPYISFCDGENDCPGGADEANCFCPGNMDRCHKGLDKFGNTPCINQTRTCDGYVDCWDKSDEDRATCSDICSEKANGSHSVYCEYAMDSDVRLCVDNLSLFLCDGHRDCLHGEDESPMFCGHPNNHNCSSQQHQCLTGECIPNSWVCDGENDCVEHEYENEDGLYSDELYCNGAAVCHYTEYQCDNKCITAHQICDGFNDCESGKDEDYCKDNCPEEYARCETGATIYSTDTLTNITVGDLPVNCFSTNSTFPPCLLAHCTDMSDIRDCNCEDIQVAYNYYGVGNGTDDSGLFSITGRMVCPVLYVNVPYLSCISENSTLVCNGFDDCADGSDEINCVCEFSKIWANSVI